MSNDSKILPCPFFVDAQMVIVDQPDWNLVKGYDWYLFDRYIAARIDGRVVKLHRLLLGVGVDTHVDHINGDTLDNRRCNLRPCTRSQNQANRKLNADNTSGVKGVGEMRNGRYRARVQANGKRVHLGVFDTIGEAKDARDKYARSVHGEFFRAG